MNAAILIFIVILVSKTDCFVHQKTSDVVKEEAEHSVFDQNTQNPIDSNSESDTNSITWSEILANVLVNSIRLIKDPSRGNEIQKDILENSTQDKLINKFCSQVLYVYKHFIYDKFVHHDSVDATFATSSKKHDNVELREMESSSQEASNDFEVITLNPDVEMIAPQYRGKLCSDCDEHSNQKRNANSNDCPEGLARDAAGNCNDPKSLNFITSIPQQCPLGYKRDWFGYCKPIF